MAEVEIEDVESRGELVEDECLNLHFADLRKDDPDQITLGSHQNILNMRHLLFRDFLQDEQSLLNKLNWQRGADELVLLDDNLLVQETVEVVDSEEVVEARQRLESKEVVERLELNGIGTSV